MAKTKYHIHLSEEDKTFLNDILLDEEASERKKIRARILLLSDENNDEKLSVPEVAERVGTTHTTVQTVRQTYGLQGVEAAVNRKKHTRMKEHGEVRRTDYSKSPSKMTPEAVEKVLAIASSEPPAGKKKWTIRAIADECVRIGLFDSISVYAIHKVLNVTEEDDGK